MSNNQIRTLGTPTRIPIRSKRTTRRLLDFQRRSIRIPRNLLLPEVKHCDILNNNVSATSAAAFYHLTNIAEGTDDGERIGRSILATMLQFHGISRFNTSNTDTYQFVRYIIFVDTSDELATAPVIANLLDSTNATAQSVAPINSSYLDRYIVLHDVLHTLSTYVPYVQSKFAITFNQSTYRISNTTWNGSTAAAYGKNHLWLCIIGSGTTNMHGSVTYTRCTYIDS